MNGRRMAAIAVLWGVTLGAAEPLRAVRIACTARGVERATLEAAIRVELLRAQSSSIDVIIDDRPCAAEVVELELVGTSTVELAPISVDDVPPVARARAIAIMLRERVVHQRERERPAAVASGTVALTREASPSPASFASPSLASPASPSAALPEPAPASPEPEPPAHEVWAVVNLRYVARHELILVGAAVRGVVSPWPPLSLELGLSVHVGRRGHALGSTGLAWPALVAGLAYPMEWGPLVLRVGPRAEVGLAHLWASPASVGVVGRSVTGPVLAVGAAGALCWSTQAGLEPCVAAEVSGVVRGVEGMVGDVPLIGAAGVVGGLAVGVRARPWAP